MQIFLQLFINGLANGALYALVALGFVIIYKASDVTNFAQGELLLIGAYVAFAFVGQFGLPWTLGMALTLAVSILLGFLVERLVLRPLIGEPIISVIMVTIGLSSLLRSIVTAVWGTETQSFPTFIPTGALNILGVNVPLDKVLAIMLALALVAMFAAFFRYSREGIAMRAVADDQQAALSVGIPVTRVFAISWAIAALTAAIAGILLANILGVSGAISRVGLRVFPAVILGGLDSIPGAIIGGVTIGLLEALAGGYIGHGLGDVLPFVVLVLILMVRPYGLFGKPIIERV